MKITEISLQVNNKNRVNIFVDGKYRSSLDVFQVGELGVKLDREYTESELQNLENESQFGKLYGRAVEYCLTRPRAIRELRDYLWRKTRNTKKRHRKTGEIIEVVGVKTEIADRVLERLIEKKYLDDQKFADFWLEYRFLKKGISQKRLKMELIKKGVDNHIIAESLAKTKRSDSSELAKIILKKRKKYPDKQKFMQYLVRQGFSFDDVKQAIEADNSN